ncbi:MAG: hypothetical protein EB060_11870 [Proteobacteria bacterium]|nr:hypothetical protein [Pseudomonadota bacterium]
MMAWLYSLDTLVIVSLLFLGFILTWEIAFRFGRRLANQRGKDSETQSQSIEASVLTLFALLLGFSFSMSSGRFEVRKQTVLEESNAIGTAYLRASVLDAQPKQTLRRALRQYLDARIELYQLGNQETELRLANKKADHAQKEAWEVAVHESNKFPTPIHALVLTSLNQMIDLREKQQFSFENVVPQLVLGFLLVLSLLAIGVVGYLNGLCRNRHRGLSLIFALVVMMTLFPAMMTRFPVTMMMSW